MEKEFGFNQELAKKVEDKASTEKSLVGGEDFFNHASDLEIERLVRESLPEYQDLRKKLELLEEEYVKFKQLQDKHFDKLSIEFKETKDLLDYYFNSFQAYKEKKDKLSHLNRKNFEFHMSLDKFDSPVTEEEKEINLLQSEVNELWEKIKEEKMQEQYKILEEKYFKLDKEISSSIDFYTKNPSDN